MNGITVYMLFMTLFGVFLVYRPKKTAYYGQISPIKYGLWGPIMDKHSLSWTSTFTFWGCNGRQGVHVRGLPALHHGLAHDLQVCIRLIVAGASVVPGGLAVLSTAEYGLSCGGHFVVIWRRRWWLFGVCLTVGRTVSPLRREWKARGSALYRAQKCWHGLSFTAGQRLTRIPRGGRRCPRSSVEQMIHSAVNNWLTSSAT